MGFSHDEWKSYKVPKHWVNIEMSSDEAKLKATLLAAPASVCLGTFDIILISVLLTQS